MNKSLKAVIMKKSEDTTPSFKKPKKSSPVIIVGEQTAINHAFRKALERQIKSK